MGGRGHTSQGTRGTKRPRALCPVCSRSTAVTFDARTGEAYLRPHKRGESGVWCVAPGKPRKITRAAIDDALW